MTRRVCLPLALPPRGRLAGRGKEVEVRLVAGLLVMRFLISVWAIQCYIVMMRRYDRFEVEFEFDVSVGEIRAFDWLLV